MKNKKLAKLLKYSSFAMIAPLVIPLAFSCTTNNVAINENNANNDSTNNDVNISISNMISSSNTSNNVLEPQIKINNQLLKEDDFSFEWMVLNNNSWQKIESQTNKNLNITNDLLTKLNNKQIKLKIIDKTNPNNVWYSNICLVSVKNDNQDNQIPGNSNDSNPENNDSTSQPNKPDNNPSQPSNPNNPVADKWGVQGIDWFVENGKDPNVLENRITLVTTTNENIIKKYGNVPLPWKEDNKITQQDLVNMFSYKAMAYIKDISMSFGQRKIFNNELANAYVEWNTTQRKYLPYVAESRGNYFFKNRTDTIDGKTVDIDNWNDNDVKSLSDKIFNHNWVVDGTTHSGFSTYTGINNTNWFLENNEQRKIFEEFLWTLMSRLQPNMTELDKFMIAYDCVENWLRQGSDAWGSPDVLSTNMGINPKHQGVCTTFGGLLSFALNAVGIKAIGIQTQNAEDPSHYNTWVYLDITGNDKEENKKWYQSDPLWSIHLLQDETYYGNSAITKNLQLEADAKKLMLFDPSINRTTLNDTFKDQRFNGRAQFTHNRISNLIWTTPYKENKVSFGNKTYYKNTPWALNDSANELRSKYVFIKGHWYYLCKESGKQLHLKKVTYKGFDKQITKSENVDDKLGDYKALILKQDAVPLMMQINNKVVFVENNTKNENKKMIIVDIDENNNDNLFDWNSKKEFDLSSAKSNIENMNLKNLIISNFVYEKTKNIIKIFGKENISYSTKREFTLDLKEFNFELDNKKQKSSFDVWKSAEHIKIEAGNWAVNDIGYNNYSLKEKQDFYKEIDNIVANSKSINNANENYQKLLTLYKSNKEKASKKVNDILPSKLLNTEYTITKNTFEKYGFNFEIEGLTSRIDLPEIHNMNNDVLFDIYYKKDKPLDNEYNGFQKIVSDSTKSKINKNNIPTDSILDKDPTGYYYLELKSKTNPEKKIKTKITYLKQIDENQNRLDKGNGLLSLINAKKDFTNYNNEGSSYHQGGWWNSDNISLSIDFNNAYSLINSQYAGAKISLKYLNPESKELKTLKEINVSYGSQKTINQLNYLGSINDTNHGIYFVELNVLDNNSKTVSTIYSNFVNLYTQKDINNFNMKTWANLYQYIK